MLRPRGAPADGVGRLRLRAGSDGAGTGSSFYTDGALTRTYAIGVGTRGTPTPGGTYYLKELLLRPPEPDVAYGPYAYGPSQRS